MSTKPAAPQPVHGNYHGYYAKRPIADDHRLRLVPASLFEDARVLDIGCNEGLVTCQIAQSRNAHKVVGVDIDDTLIRAAWKRRRAIWSQQQPERSPSSAMTEVDGETSEEHPGALQAGYFPSSCEHMYGPLPIPPQSEKALFPHNVVFYASDWVNSPIPDDAEGYDVVIAFSVTKWIHLNGGDDALMQFFRRVHSVLVPYGAFLLEPQEWEGYAKAKRMDQKLKENGNKLRIRPESFSDLLVEIGFNPPEHLGHTGEGGFRRPVDLYRKIAR